MVTAHRDGAASSVRLPCVLFQWLSPPKCERSVRLPNLGVRQAALHRLFSVLRETVRTSVTSAPFVSPKLLSSPHSPGGKAKGLWHLPPFSYTLLKTCFLFPHELVIEDPSHLNLFKRGKFISQSGSWQSSHHVGGWGYRRHHKGTLLENANNDSNILIHTFAIREHVVLPAIKALKNGVLWSVWGP